VHALGRELHGRLGTLAGHLSSLGAGLERAVQSYNQTVRSMESRVLVTARRFADLGVTGEDLPGPEPVDIVPRRPEAAEFTGEPVDAAQVMPLRSAARRSWDATVDG
jgi:DNA recombination protein RmuC